MEKAKAFIKMKKFCLWADLIMSLKIPMLHRYIFAALYYGHKTWSLTNALLKKVEAFEMWVYRRILHKTWMDHVTYQ